MNIRITIECKDNEYSLSDDDRSSREMKIEINDRQIYALNVGNAIDAMLQDAAVELMSKRVEREIKVS